MAVAKITGQIDAAPEAVYDLVADPTRLADWDVSYERGTPLHAGEDGSAAFEVRRTIENRGIPLRCTVREAGRGQRFAFTCRGLEGETVEESFRLDARNGGTEMTREHTYRLPGQDLGVVSQATYAEALTQRGIEQAFARLNLLFGGGAPDAAQRPGDTDTRSEDTGGISVEEDYSANRSPTAEPQRGLPPVPDRPT
jgi:uncharacterized protein YndB with AHSA1/START domain